MNCTVIFKRSEGGDIEMYRRVNHKIALEGEGLDGAVLEFQRKLYSTLMKMPSNQQLVLYCELHENPTRQDYDR